MARLNMAVVNDEPNVMQVKVRCSCGCVQEEYVDADKKVKDAMGKISCMFCGVMGQCKMVGGL